MEVFEAVADPVRRDLLTRLLDGPSRVVDLAAAHPISRPAISRHLKVLADVGLVEAETVGRERRYRVRLEGLEPLSVWLDEMRPPTSRFSERALDGLDLEVRRTVRERAAGRPATEHDHPHHEETA
ncbi:metalloregulator ArsR/SmtB family transcription factor [Mumia sp. zg.B17]|uniref:ArsR/SmtB family transcription factor n=1 Tax=Mumia sp. zg.B17 TaxID=2855446 RepID=UPI001C6E067B|nr:metalloregulator ArsR/SmtB family transcription factor [Mumia sp. zg.B17]MBW9207794.1 metalloregulator ArsR/SmtB family transcription factor [Mumia sp. zg.B17]